MLFRSHTAQTREALADLIHQGDWDQLLTRVPVKAGDFFYVPSGTMHAIGEGILILETQQSSDTTYRVYDFDRKDDQGKLRELHLDKSIDVLSIGEIPNSHPSTIAVAGQELTTLVSNPFFTVHKWNIHSQTSFQRFAPYLLVSVLDGQGTIAVDGQTYPIQKGSHFILTSDIENWQLDGELELIVSHV